tara:strand:- start:512 stop:808 length:297 start_codon:yes stop_codon:yes gene_type:complete
MARSKRYYKEAIRLDVDTSNRYKTIPKYNDSPISGTDLWIRATEGARLDIISNDFYGTVKHWWVIALANKMGKGTLYVTPGAQLRIPANPSIYYDSIE